MPRQRGRRTFRWPDRQGRFEQVFWYAMSLPTKSAHSCGVRLRETRRHASVSRSLGLEGSTVSRFSSRIATSPRGLKTAIVLFDPGGGTLSGSFCVARSHRWVVRSLVDVRSARPSALNDKLVTSARCVSSPFSRFIPGHSNSSTTLLLPFSPRGTSAKRLPSRLNAAELGGPD